MEVWRISLLSVLIYERSFCVSCPRFPPYSLCILSLLCPSYWQKAAESEPWHPTCLDSLNPHRCSIGSSKSWAALFCRESPAAAGPQMESDLCLWIYFPCFCYFVQ